MKKLFLPNMALLFCLMACAPSQNLPDLAGPQSWFGFGNNPAQAIAVEQPAALKTWWRNFDDPAIQPLITLALDNAPNRRLVMARINEARGQRRTANSALFPQIGASASTGRADNLQGGIGDTNDARFDASYEIDLFGRNRNNLSAADNAILALQAEYHDVTLTLIAEIIRTIIDIRQFDQQVVIAQENLLIQSETLKLIETLVEFGENSQLDAERAAQIVNATRAAVPAFERQAQNSRLQLVTLVGAMPSRINALLNDYNTIPGSDLAPIMLAPADVMANRPDLKAARASLSAATDLSAAAYADLFPTLSLGGFYGTSENSFAGPDMVWDIVANAAVALLDFGRIEGQIDAARAREMQSYEQYRTAIFAAVADTESALNNAIKFERQAASLNASYKMPATHLIFHVLYMMRAKSIFLMCLIHNAP